MSGLREELKLTQISVLGNWKNSNSINAEKEYLEVCLRMAATEFIIFGNVQMLNEIMIMVTSNISWALSTTLLWELKLTINLQDTLIQRNLLMSNAQVKNSGHPDRSVWERSSHDLIS